MTRSRSYTPDVKRILPLNGGEDAAMGGYMEFSPNAEAVLSALVPEYVSGLLCENWKEPAGEIGNWEGSFWGVKFAGA